MKKLLLIISIALFSSCDVIDERNAELVAIFNKTQTRQDSVKLLDRITKLETQVKALTRLNDSIAWEFEHYRYWLWKEHNLTEHDYSTYDYSYSICKPAPLNEELQKRTKLPSKDKNSLY